MSGVTERVRENLHDVGSLGQHLWREIGWRDVRSGQWFSKLLTSYVRYHEAHRSAPAVQVSVEARDAQVRALIERSALIAAVSGAGAAVGVTAASLSTSQSGGVAVPFVWPVAVLGMTGEMVLRALIHLRMACDIADLYGLHFPEGSEGELVRVYALAVHAEMHETDGDPGRGIVERVVRPNGTSGLGKLIAARLVGESLLRNAIPFVDVAVSSIQNYKLGKEAGSFFHAYVARRVQLDAAVKELGSASPDSVELLLEGIWFIFISDGRLTGVETALLAHLLRREGFENITPRFVSDEASWLERLESSDPRPTARSALLQALTLAASVDGALLEAEAAIVRHAAQSLGLAWESPAA